MQKSKLSNKKPKVVRTFFGAGLPTLHFTDLFMVVRYETEVAALHEKYRKLIEAEQNNE